MRLISSTKNETSANRPLPTDDLQIILKPEDFIALELLKLQLNAFVSPVVTADQFLAEYLSTFAPFNCGKII